MPGSLNVACTVHLLSGGGSGMKYGGDHGEFAYDRGGALQYLAAWDVGRGPS